MDRLLALVMRTFSSATRRRRRSGIKGRARTRLMNSTMSTDTEPEGLWDWPMQADDGIVRVHNDAERFEVHLDAAHFAPMEIKVNVVGRLIDIHAEHKSKAGPIGDVARSFNRSYKLPDDVNECSVKSWLSTRGYLVIRAAKKAHISYPERLIIHDYS